MVPAGSSSSYSDRPAHSHHRRRSSVSPSPSRPANLQELHSHQAIGALLPTIVGTPSNESPMTFSRSPSPSLLPIGGWSSPGLNTSSDRSSPVSNHSAQAMACDPYKMVNGRPSIATQNTGFFNRHMRRISNSLPRFTTCEKGKMSYSSSRIDKVPLVGRIKLIFGRMGRKLKFRLLIALLVLFCIWIFYHSPLVYWYRRAAWGGGGSKFVIVLAANVGGGVMEWKGAREWAIERDSIRNKRKYVARWGYDLEIVDMSTKKRYAHEWREGWEKADFLRNSMRKYPDAEWFWWLDLTTIVMEPSYSLQDHIFNSLERYTYRDINTYNPLNITHPFTDVYLDDESRSPVGDGNINSVNLLLSQDCSGFNLGSFFLRRSVWTERLLDIWWDPVAYEQKHMAWEHKEQDALEAMYDSHPWVRQHTGFLPQRMINSFPPAACGDGSGTNHTRYHYHEKDRDFVVNMAGCEWGRDCWGEMYHYRQFSYWLNRNPWERFKEDFVAVIWYHLTGQHVRL